MSSSIKIGRGRGRGVLALTSFEPLPRPIINNTAETLPSSVTAPIASNHAIEVEKVVNIATVSQENAPAQQQTGDTPEKKPINVVKPWENGSKGEIKVMAKYAYQANPNRPGGFDELSVEAGEKLTLVKKGHVESKNPHWCEVRNAKGETGFVGTSYLLILEETPSSLPWLENKRLLEEKERKEKEVAAKGDVVSGAPSEPPTVRAYHSAYGESRGATNAAEAAKKYYCDICDKNLNGPQPYKMHMSSKAHREEMEYQALS